jgi:hypothetical protein
MNRRIDLPDELALAPFTVREAIGLGVPRSRLRRADLRRPYRGVRTPTGDPRDLRDLCDAYRARMPQQQVFSHSTAARLLGVPLPWRWERDSDLHVLVPAGQRPPQMRGIIGHECRPDAYSVTLLDALAMSSPVSAWTQLGTMLTELELVVAGDFLVSTTLKRPVSLATIDELRSAVERGGGRRGIRALRGACARIRTGVESPKETEVRLIVVDAGFPEPVTNYTLRDARQAHVARMDLAFPRYRVGLDYEGDGHRTDRRQFRKDITRGEDVHDLGWRLIRLTDDDLGNGASRLIARLDRQLRARGWRPA